MIRPKTVSPYPYSSFENLDYNKVKGVLDVEMSIPAQMIYDVRLAVKDHCPIETCEPIGAPLGDRMDELIVMNGPSLNKFLYKLKKGGNLFINSSIVKEEIMRDDITVISAPVTELAMEIGSPKVLNLIMLGVYVGFSQVVPEEAVLDSITSQLGKKAGMMAMNKEAYEKGLGIGKAARMAL